MQTLPHIILPPAYAPVEASFPLEGFATWLRDSGVADNTVRSYLSRLSNFSSYMQSRGGSNAHEGLHAAAAEYLQSLRQQDRTASSQRSFCVALTSYCHYKDVPRPPLQVKAAPAAPAEILTPAQEQRLLEILQIHCSDRDRAMLGAMLLLGLRTGECARADISDLYVQDEIVFLKVRTTSGGTARAVPLSALARQLLGSWIVSRRRMTGVATTALFVSSGADRIHPNTVRWTVRRAGSLMAMQLSPQMLRNTWKSHRRRS